MRHGASGEQPFGTIKARMGATHFLLKTMTRVSSEMDMHVLATSHPRHERIDQAVGCGIGDRSGRPSRALRALSGHSVLSSERQGLSNRKWRIAF